MALGKKCGSLKSKHAAVIAEDEKLGLGLGYYTRGFGRKRIAASKNGGALALDSNTRTPLKRRCSKRRTSLVSGIEDRNGSESSPLESLPQDVLIRIVCGVDHDDLEQLVHVSKAIREATWVAKQCHFAYSTPMKNRSNFRTSIDFDDIEAPNAPRQSRACRSRVSGKSLADISVALFADDDMMSN